MLLLLLLLMMLMILMTMMTMLIMMIMIAIFVYKNIHNSNCFCNYYIADHEAAAAAAADHAAAAAAAVAAAAAADDDDGDVDGDSFKFQMLSINMLTMIVMSNIITTAITHLPALRCLTPATAGMDTPPYTCLLTILLVKVMLKLQNSWSS